MRNLVAWFLAFTAGVTVGALGAWLLPRFNHGRKRRSEMLHARERILAGIREQHDQDIRREIFQTAEALRGELNRSLRRLLNLTERVLGPEKRG